MAAHENDGGSTALLSQISTDVAALKADNQETRTWIRKVTEILERLTTLEADRRASERNQERVDRELQELFTIHRSLADTVGKLASEVSGLAAAVKSNTKSGDRWMHLVFSVSSSVITAFVVAKIIAP